MLNKLFSNAYARMRYLRFRDMRPFLTKVFNVSLSFLMIFTLAFVTIETINPEPVAAASWDCLDSSGRPIAFQTKYDNGNLYVITYNFSTNQETTTTFSSGFSGSGEINASFMDLDGNLYVQRKTSNSNGVSSRLYLVNPTGSPTLVDSSSAGINLNAATFFVDNGYEYAISGKGHFSSSGGYVRFSSDTTLAADKTYTLGSTNTSGGSISRSKAKDFTWIRDNSNFPTMFNGKKPNFIGIDGQNQRIYVSSYTITNQGNSNEAIEIETQSYSISLPSSERSAFGAIYGFGSDQIYALNNDTGNIYKVNISGSGYSVTDTGDDGATTSNNDGAACHAGDPTVTFNPSVTATQGSCDGSNREIDVTLNNSSSNVASNFVVTYTVNGGSAQSLTSGTSVSSSSNNTSLSVPGQANGAAVVISWYAENTANNLREPNTGTTALSSITIDASGCSSSPTAVAITASTSLGSCSGGSATSPFNFANSSGTTAYVTVEYSTDGGSSWTVHPQAQANTSNDLVIGSGTSPGQLSSISVPHGSAITWRYKSTDTEGDWTGISYVTLSATSTVNCPTTTFTTSTSAGSCSAGSSTPTISVTNTGNSTGYYDVQWSTDNSSWTTLQDGNAISSSATETYSVSSAQTHGTTVYFQVRSGLSNPSSGSYTAASSVTVSCETLTFTLSQALSLIHISEPTRPY